MPWQPCRPCPWLHGLGSGTGNSAKDSRISAAASAGRNAGETVRETVPGNSAGNERPGDGGIGTRDDVVVVMGANLRAGGRI